MIWCWLDGNFYPQEQASLSLRNRAIRFGDGVFETLLVHQGKPCDMPAHIRRLERGLKHYGIPLDITPLPALCQELVNRNALQTGYIRIIITRGNNPPEAIGYALPVAPPEPTLYIETFIKPFPAFQTLTLAVVEGGAVWHSPCKTISALPYVMAMQQAGTAGADNALLTDSHGRVCETGSGNIFWIKNNILYTPSATLNLIPGTMREKVLDLWPGTVQQGEYRMQDILDADAVFMTNIGTVLAAVNQILPFERQWPVPVVVQTFRETLVHNLVR